MVQAPRPFILNFPMITTVNKHLLLVMFLSVSIFLIPIVCYSKDITNKVIKETQLDEQISLFCSIYCLGNEKEGILKSLTLTKADNNNFKVQGKAALRNRQVAGEPLNVTVFDRTVIVNSVGTLNSENCELKVDDVTIENDFQNIVTNLLKANNDIIGKVIEVPDCKKFLN